MSLDWARLSALYDEGERLQGPAREAWWAKLQHEPAELLKRLQRMLAGDGPKLDTTALRAPLAAALASDEQALHPGDRLGAWALVAPLGRGGMGEVWLAERADGLYQAQAAIKLLRTDLSGPELAQRFARERSLLGRLRHPGIARLLDAGVDAEHGAFLVLEYVAGQDLNTHVREARLDVAARVRLLVAVAQAVEAAHAQLIVHRDLKPGNVMVTPDGTPKLLDFGIAALLDPDADISTDLTLVAGRRLTPAYAAPEQIAGDRVGTAADVYALGVLLYELLTGLLPHGEERSTRTQMEHAVLHSPLPRMATLLGLPERERGPGRPPNPRAALGDLEAVCAKALRRLPEERYPSVSAFIDELQRWLRHLPVSVRREHWQHRSRLWMRRNRAVAVGGTLVLLTLSAGLAVSLWQRQLAHEAASEAEQVSTYLTELLSAASPDQNGGRQPTLIEVLDRKRDELPQRFNNEPAVKDRIYETLVGTYHALQRFDVVAPLAQARLDHARALWGEDDERTEAAIVDLARMHTAIASSKPVVDLLAPLLPKWDRRFGQQDQSTTNLRYQLITAYGRLGRFSDAERELAIARAANEVLNADNEFDRVFFATYEVAVRTGQGRLREAEALMLGTRSVWANPRPDRRRFALVLERNLAMAQWRLLRDDVPTATARAEDLIARADAMMRPGNDLSAVMRHQLALTLQAQGAFDAALAQLRRAESDTANAGMTHAVTTLLRRVAKLEAQVLAAGRGNTASTESAAKLLQELNDAAIINGPRRAEGLLALGRIATAPGANGAALARELARHLADPSLGIEQALALRSRAALHQGRTEGTAASLLQGTLARVAYFDSLPEPQGVPEWAARLQHACALQLNGHATAQALSRADGSRPSVLPAGHPLDDLREALAHGEASLNCGWAF